MKPTYITHKGAELHKRRWRIIIPASMTGRGKRECRFFDTKEQADQEIARLKFYQQHNRQMAESATVASNELIHLIKIGDDELAAVQAFIEAIRKKHQIILAVRRVAE